MSFWQRLFGLSRPTETPSGNRGVAHSADAPPKHDVVRARDPSPRTPAVSVPRELMDVITRNDLFNEGDLVAKATKEIRESGAPGSEALAALISQLLKCRNAKLSWALVAAKEARNTPQLQTSIEAILTSSPVCQGNPGRFPPEILGGGKIGLTDGTWANIQDLARKALEKLHEGPEPVLTNRSQQKGENERHTSPLPEDNPIAYAIARFGSKLTEAANIAGNVTSADNGRSALLQVARILAGEPGQEQIVATLRTASQQLGDDAVIQFCQNTARSLLNQAEGLAGSLRNMGAL